MISTCSKREVSSQFKLKSAKLTSVGIVASSQADAFSWNDILEDKQYSCFFFFSFFFLDRLYLLCMVGIKLCDVVEIVATFHYHLMVISTVVLDGHLTLACLGHQ